MSPRASVIVATFNQPNSLRLVLAALGAQTERDFEVVVADDGSRPETRRIAESHGARHVWQENRGFRKARVVNAAVRESRGPTLLFLDGDTIPRLDHVERHLAAAGPRRFAVGGYVNVPEAAAQALTPDAVARGDHHAVLTPAERLRLLTWHAKNRLYIALKTRRRPKTYGCNFSVARDVFYEINGFDENYDGAGQEESDLRNRLLLARARPASVWNRVWVFHLPRSLDPLREATEIPRRKNKEYYKRPLTSPRCERGLCQ